MKKLLIITLAALFVTMLFACRDKNTTDAEEISTQSTSLNTVVTNEIIPDQEEQWGELIPIESNE